MSLPLIVIDMQPSFSYTAHRCLEASLHEIRLAKRRKAPIIIVEYTGCGNSYTKIINLVKDYDQVIFVKKDFDGGGRPIMKAIRKNGLKTRKFRVCGVNRSWCVYSTVTEMFAIARDLIIEISEKASWCNQPITGLERLESVGCRIK